MTNDYTNIIALNDENGEEVRFEFLDLITYMGKEYVVLLPIDEDTGEVVILELEEALNDDEEVYASVEDNDVLMAVYDIFKDKFKDTFNFVE